MLYVIESNYTKILLDTGVNISPDTVFNVSTKLVDGTEKYFVEELQNVKLYLVSYRNIIYPNSDKENLSYKELYKDMENDRNSYRTRAWKAEKELENLKAEVKANE